MDEIWVDIVGYDGKYRLSNKGNVESTNYNNTGKAKLLKPKINRYGYKEVKLSKNGQTKNYLVSTLVGLHFLPNTIYKDVVMFITKDKSDVSTDNLKWAYHSECRHNMYNKGSRKVGKPTKTKITYEGKRYKTYSQIAKDHNISLCTFYQRLYNYNWSLYEAIETPVGRK